MTINTHKGLYRVNRLPYGVASAPAIFQKLMDQVLQGIDGVIYYLDDILITGQDSETQEKPGRTAEKTKKPQPQG